MPGISKRERIVAGVVEALKGIRVASGYNTDLKSVTRFQKNPFTELMLPAASVYDLAEDPVPQQQTNLQFEERILTLVIEAYIRETKPDQLSTQLNALQDDLYVCLTADRQWSGMALITWYRSVRTIEGDTPAIGGKQIEIQVVYRHLYGNPTGP